MERLGSLLWGSLTVLALLGLLANAAAPGAVAAPVVRITEPAHGQVVQGQILVSVAYRTDSDQPITKLELLVDRDVVREYPLATPRLTGTKSFSWDFTTAAGTTHTLGARAVDAAGEAGSAEITVTVQGARTVADQGADRIPPVINIYYPGQGAELSGEVEVKAEASDNVSVRCVFFYIDGEVHKIIMNAPPFVARWDTTKWADGPHVLQARAMDDAENAGTSAEVTVLVENHDMTTAPAGTLQTQSATEGAPGIGAGDAAAPAVTETTFGAQPDQPTMVAALPSGEAAAARVGYVPRVREHHAEARASEPRRPADLTAAPTADDVPDVIPSVAAPDEPVTEQIAAAQFSPRLTTPRGLHEIEPVMGDVAMPDLTAPSREASGAVALQSGWTTLKPTLQVTPEQRPAPRATRPARTLTPAEMLAPDSEVSDAAVITEPAEDAGELIARVEMTSSPGTADVASASAMMTPQPAETGGTRIAVLPERATRATIPADGRMTRPDGAQIAPVATMSFEDVQVLVNNDALELLAQPEVRDGMSIAPLREIFEHSDGVLYWYPVEKRVRATRPGTEMQIQIGDPTVQVNEQARVLQVAPYIKQGRTMVPLQFVADTLDMTVTFNPETGQICLTSNEL